MSQSDQSSLRGSTNGLPESEGLGLCKESETPSEKSVPVSPTRVAHPRQLSVAFADSVKTEGELKERQESRRMPPSRRSSPLSRNETSMSTTWSASGKEATPQSVGFLRKLSSYLQDIPLGFFQSRAEVRTWGEEKLTDPSVQPYRQPRVITPFHQTLPGYGKEAVKPLEQELMGGYPGQFFTLAPKGGFVYNPHHPNMDFARVEIEYPTPSGAFKPPTYEWRSQPECKMMNLPYTNALMLPANPTTMYVSGSYMTAYPYGVPAVEENEGSVRTPPASRRCQFLC
ncbi:UNVERIFIED_CONTAM: hypothetical protein HHA_258470 [Hammondia hammondi]|eukprot:XP_008883165.1 hypothetical protein HHA_258470 [Hammondia hammondi]